MWGSANRDCTLGGGRTAISRTNLQLREGKANVEPSKVEMSRGGLGIEFSLATLEQSGFIRENPNIG